MKCITNEPPALEDDYPGLDEVVNGYLTGERPIDDVLKHPDFSRLGPKECGKIVRSAEKGKSLFQSLCAQILRHDTEGPPANLKACRAQSLRAVGLHTLDEFWAYFRESARNLARSGWRRGNRRHDKAPTYSITAADLSGTTAKGVCLEDKLRLIEAFEVVSALSKEHLNAFCYWLQDYSTREIAKIMGYSHVAVQALIRDALREVRGQTVGTIRKAS